MEAIQKSEKISLRRENRILAVQWVYMCEAMGIAAEPEHLHSLCALGDQNPANFKFAQEMVMLLQKNLVSIDALIDRFALNWNLARISRVDLCILRIATCELCYRNDIPPIVTINEAIELGKIFSGENAKVFINGVLDRIKSTLSRSLRTNA
ncbi:MAG: transcription antitermination factor NusB [Puniceicoccales bacterium]|jgi:N utilization substance protein B|nr:transcription antitermination factor NusB [Puniceicoccales bacterium]